jgi:hypothetical protein
MVRPRIENAKHGRAPTPWRGPGHWNCGICGGDDSDAWTCSGCRSVARLIPTLPGPLYLIVDGSHMPQTKLAGAGLVLVHGSLIGDVVAHCACKFRATNANSAEYHALRRGMLWAPGVPVHTDSRYAVDVFSRRGYDVSWIPHGAIREPNHAMADRLSVVGRRSITGS